MRTFNSAFFLAVLWGLPAGSLAAPQEEAAPVQAGSARAQYDQILTQWKDVLAEFGVLKTRYRQAGEAQKAEIEKQWQETVAKGDRLEPKLIEAAEKAYAESPNTDRQLADLLVDILVGDVQKRKSAAPTDNYERAYRIGRLLMDHACPDKQVADAAGIAAYVIADFDTAEKYLKRAEQQASLTDVGEDYLRRIPQIRKDWAKEQQIRQAEAKADDLPRVLLKTTKGDIELELFENEAPNTVANFISLVRRGFYDGLSFHRVLPTFMAQGGCPTGDGMGGPGYEIPCECYQANYRKHFRGSLSMAHAGRDTGGSQFFITFVPTSFLDARHTAFGRVVNGFDVLQRIQRRDPDAPRPPKPDRILEAKVLRDRGHPYEPKKKGQ